MPTDPDALARAVAESMLAGDRASRGLGMRVEEIGPGRAVLSMIVAERMVNGLGICHGGFIFCLADSAMAFASNSHGERAVAQHGAISFLRPGHLNETLHAKADERSRGQRSAIYDVRVTAGNGETVAEFRGHTRGLGTMFFATEP